MTESESDYSGVLIYDGECPLCSAASTALRRLRHVGTVEWSHDAARRFLEAQFGDVPFALVFVDREAERVWAGRAAARELCERAGVPTLVGDVVGDNYEALADAIRRVSAVEDEPDPYHGEYPLSPEAEAAYDRLAEHARSTHAPAGSRRRS